MTGLSGQNKGKRGEREIKDMFIDLMDEVEKDVWAKRKYSEDVKRNTLQSDRGGCDIVGIPLLAIEVKRQEILSINTWFKQAKDQAAKLNLMPVLMFKQNRKQWRVVTYAGLSYPGYKAATWATAEVGLTDFLSWYKAVYREFLTVEQGK
jgi:hypothetical protein